MPESVTPIAVFGEPGSPMGHFVADYNEETGNVTIAIGLGHCVVMELDLEVSMNLENAQIMYDMLGKSLMRANFEMGKMAGEAESSYDQPF